MISFFIPGKPVAQSRPRFARRGKFTVAYDAAPAKDYKSWVKSRAIEAMEQAGLKMVERDVPLRLSATINLARPKSRAKRHIMPTTKPDCDNVLKGLQDAMESIVYEADQQIVETHTRKQYHVCPGVLVEITEYKE